MLHPVKLRLIKETGDEEVIEAELSEDEWDRLEAYLKYVEELASTRLGRSGIAAHLQINWEQESQGLSIQTELPPDDDIAALLHKLRPFILQKERTYFMTVCSILGKHLSSPYIRGFLRQTRYLFDGRQLMSTFRITVNGEAVLNSDAVLDLWLNAHEYHRDREKQKKLEELTPMSFFDGTKVIFLRLLVDKVQAIYAIHSLVASVLGKESTIHLAVKPSFLKQK